MSGHDRSLLLSDRLKRKKNVRTREHNENNVPQALSIRASQPWRPAGSSSSKHPQLPPNTHSCQGVQPLQRRSLPPTEPLLTSTFSVRESLRSSRVFRQPDGKPQDTSRVLPARASGHQAVSTSTGRESGQRAVLRPVGVPAISASRTSSCGSNSILERAANSRASCSSLNSGANPCSSPTDDGQPCSSARTSQAACRTAAMQQHKGPGRPVNIPELAQSCSELLQLLLMDDSPACSEAGPSATGQASPPLPSSPPCQEAVSGPCVDQQRLIPAASAHLQQQWQPNPCVDAEVQHTPQGILQQTYLQQQDRQQMRQPEQALQQQRKPQGDHCSRPCGAPCSSAESPTHLMGLAQHGQEQTAQQQEEEISGGVHSIAADHARLALESKQRPDRELPLEQQQQQQPLPQPPPQHNQVQAQHCEQNTVDIGRPTAMCAAQQQPQHAAAAQQFLQQQAPEQHQQPQQPTLPQVGAGQPAASPLRASNAASCAGSQPSSYSSLLEATKALCANSQAATQHLQRKAASPFKLCSSPGRFGPSCLSRGPSGTLSAAPTGRQRSRLSQSWGAASPGHHFAHQLQQQQQFGGAPGVAWPGSPQCAAAAGEAAKGRKLFGPPLGLGLLQCDGPPLIARATRAVGSAAAASGFSSAPRQPTGAQLQPAVVAAASPTAARSPFSSFSRSSTVAVWQQPGGHLPSSPVPPSSSRPVLCTSRVAQVLFGTPSAAPQGWHEQQQQQQHRLHGMGSPSAGELPSRQLHFDSSPELHHAKQQQDQQSPFRHGNQAAACTRYHGHGTAGAATASGRYVDMADSGPTHSGDDDADSDCGSLANAGDQEVAGGVASRGAGAEGCCAVSDHVSSKQQLHGQHEVGVAGVYEHKHREQQEEECWTVHTNWVADLDLETAAVAAAAAAAAGLSAQLGRGHAVRLLEHSPFPLAAEAAGVVGDGCTSAAAQAFEQQQVLQPSGCCSPMWLSMHGVQHSSVAGGVSTPGQANGQQQQQEQHQGPPVVSSPVCLLVPRKLWDSPA